VQDTSCRESEGVPQFLLSPPRVGARGLKGDSFDSLHPEGIYGGFPVKHGMTYCVVIMMTLYQPGLPLKLCPAIILDKGVEELSHTP
jgi:hypothetical protein